MTEIKQVLLESTPVAFQEAVNKQLKIFEGWSPQILAMRSLTNTSYADKTIISTSYKAYFAVGNAMFIVKFEETTKPEWNNCEPSVDCLTIGDIEVLVRNSDWLRDICKKAIQDVEKIAAK